MKWTNVGQLKYGKNPPITLILVNIKITVMKKKKKKKSFIKLTKEKKILMIKWISSNFDYNSLI